MACRPAAVQPHSSPKNQKKQRQSGPFSLDTKRQLFYMFTRKLMRAIFTVYKSITLTIKIVASNQSHLKGYQSFRTHNPQIT
jgi:hypothetical protein